MGFNASEVVEPLDYDFTPYGGKGTVPEPSDNDIDRLQKVFQSVGRELGVEVGEKLDSEAMEQVTQRLGDDAEERVKEINRRMLMGLADFCKGTPSLQELESLPVRVRNAFIGWLMGQFTPEA